MLRSGRFLPGLLVGVSLVLAAGEVRANVFDDEVVARRAELSRRVGQPGAIASLLGVIDLWEWVSDRNAIATLLDAAKDDARQRPDVRARAAFLRSLVADSQGDAEEAHRLRAGIGLVTDWQVLGPFDNEGRSADRKELPPERDLARPVDGKERYQGKQHEVSWRRFPAGRVRQGVLALSVPLQPDEHVLGYATTFVRVDRDQVVAARVGSSGALSMWVGATPVLTDDAYRPPRLDQDVVAIRLRAGWNRITLKLGVDEGSWSFLFRLTQLDGSPLVFEASADPARAAAYVAPRAAAGKGTAAGSGAPPVAPSDLRRELKSLADTGATAAQRDYGVYLHYVAPEDPKLGAAERMLAFAAQVSGDIEGCRLAALSASDDEKARKWLEEATAAGRKGSKGERARALSQLGQVYERLHRERRAEELWQAALVEDPDYFPATLRLAELATARGLPSRARALLDGLPQRHGGVVAVLRARAALAGRQDRTVEEEALCKRIIEASRDNWYALTGLQTLSHERGEVDAEVAWLKRMAGAAPEDNYVLRMQAELLDNVGRGTEALDVVKSALADSPDEPELLKLAGRVLHRLGRDAEALSAFRRSLELHPQDPQLRAYTAAIASSAARVKGAPGGGSPGTGAGAEADMDADADDLAREFSVPVEDLVARAAKASRPEREPAWVLLDRQASRVHANGLSQTFTQRVVQVLDERGAREQGQAVIRYTPDSQSVEIKAARVHKSSGEIVEAASQSDQETSEPWYGLYYDTRAQVIELPHLEPGDVIDIEYVVSDVSARNMFGDYFGDMQMLQEDAPRMESDYILIAPRSRKLYFNKPELPGARPVTFEQRERGDERVYRFHADAVPRIRTEPGMPGITSVGTYIHVSTFESWEQMADWYRGLVREQLEPDDEIRKAVKATLAELAEKAKAAHKTVDERQKIGAIYDLVVKSTRYVGLEFGIHGYKPYRVSQIFQRKFGDCKDKASLLVAMLKLAGVDASLVLVRTRRGGDIAPYPASLAPFDHAIAWVPRYDLFLDGTAEFSGSSELPSQDQDVPVLIVTDPRAGGRGHFVRTPVPPAPANRVSRVQEVALASTGAASVKLSMEVAGQSAHDWRNHYQSAGERRERVEKSENGAHPGARARRVEFPSLEELEQPVRMEAELEVPAWARPVGQAAGSAAALTMPALGREGELSRTYARLSERQHDLVLGFPWQQDERVTITLPEGYAASRLPAPQNIETPFGHFKLAVEKSGRKVTVTAQLLVRRHRIGATEYPAFRRFCLDVDSRSRAGPGGRT